MAVLYGAAALAAGATGWYVMSRRARSPLTRPMLTILGGIAEWSLTAAATALSADLAWKTAWDAAVYLGVGTTVIGFLWYSAVFAGYAWPKGRWVWTALAAEPVMAATACATNGLHHLFYSSVSQLPSGVYAVTIGPLLWAHAGYSFALCALAVGMVVRSSFRSVAAHRRLSWLLLGGATVPLLANFGSFLAASVIDATPIGFLVAAGVFLTAERRGSKLRLVPLAAQQVLAALTDAVVVIDDSGRVLDANPAARQLLKALAPSVAEHPVGLLWPDVAGPHLGSALSGALAGRAGIKVAGRATGPRPFRSSVIHAADQAFDVRVLPIEAGKQQAMGHVIVVRDVTEMERLRTVLAEQALKDGLTGAYNRRYLMQALGPAAEHARARGE
ncbi:MAG TPA: histidine kinase N-terminal 7TM domain-containing protein, partial [Acidimicrobiales bacterium]|nr:histidine kinase N-terminal 7TM domain-containing protein [Acidimicrobiales bacterium]